MARAPEACPILPARGRCLLPRRRKSRKLLMIAGGIEAMLLVVANLFCEDVKKLATRKGRKKLNDLLWWHLNQLLDVAKEARWLPDKLTISPR
jgi:hypothetical protein